MAKRRNFTKIRKWAKDIGAVVEDSKYFENLITVTLPNGQKFEFEQRESTAFIGRDGQWHGDSAGLYMKRFDENGKGVAFKEPSQKMCIDVMTHFLNGGI